MSWFCLRFPQPHLSHGPNSVTKSLLNSFHRLKEIIESLQSWTIDKLLVDTYPRRVSRYSRKLWTIAARLYPPRSATLVAESRLTLIADHVVASVETFNESVARGTMSPSIVAGESPVFS